MDSKVLNHSNLIIANLSSKKSLNLKEKNILIKTYIRKGFSEERMEKFQKALLSFGVAKLMEPHNQQANEGVQRNKEQSQYHDSKFSYMNF